MGTATIRQRLHDYIRYADEKKVKAIYAIVEDEINEQSNLWENKAFLQEIDMRPGEYENEEIKPSTFEELRKSKQQFK